MRDNLIVTFLGFLFFLPFLGGVHLFDWDEINFAEIAREMLTTGDFFRPQVDYEPFWEKPPFFLWLQAASMSVFGVGEFGARFPNVVAGVLTLLLVFNIGRILFNRIFGWLWVLAWLGSTLPHLYFRSGIIDPWFNLLIFSGLYGFIRFRWQFFRHHEIKGFWRRYGWLLGGGWLIGLAILTKGPVAWLLALLTFGVYWARYRFRGMSYLRHFFIFSLAAVSVSALWFAAEIALHGTGFVREFLTYQARLFTTEDSGHGGFFGYHVVVLLLGCFPASVFALPNLWGDRQPQEEIMEEHTLVVCQRCDFTTWMQILFWVVLAVFSVVQTKIAHYSSLAYFPLTFLGSLTVWRAIQYSQKPRIVPVLLPILGILIGLTVAVAPYVGTHLDIIRPLFKNDAFALDCLEATTCWAWWQGLPGVVLAVSAVAGAFFWMKNKFWRSAEIVFTGGALFIALTLIFFIKNIESISQGAAIEFYEAHKKEDCYMQTIGFKSFAHLFYTRKPPVAGDHLIDSIWNLKYGKPGKTVYFVAKKTNLEDLETLPGLEVVYRKNGFVFFKRALK